MCFTLCASPWGGKGLLYPWDRSYGGLLSGSEAMLKIKRPIFMNENQTMELSLVCKVNYNC
jgi:hypothetical protein